MSFVQQLWRGFFVPIQAVRFLRTHRGLKRFILLPALLNAVLFCGMYYLAWIQAHAYLASYLEHDGVWYQTILYGAVVVLLVAALLVLVGFITVLLAGIVAAPFHALIAERVLTLAEGNTAPPGFSLALVGRDAIRSILQELRKVCFIVIIGGSLFILQFVPGLGLIVQVFLLPLFIAVTICLEFMDYGMERRRLTFKQKRRFLYRRPGVIVGFGGVGILLLSIPGINFFSIPLLVVGGTLLYLSLEAERNNRGKSA